MSRTLALAALALALPVVSSAAEPTPVEKHLAVQKAMATARQYLDVNMPAEAVATLEPLIPSADGNKAFLTLLRESYLAELYRLEKANPADPERVAQVRRNIALLGGATPPPKPAAPAPELPPPTLDSPPVAGAAAEFKKGNYAEAARLFAAAGSLTPEQKAAWAYCRIRIAADAVNAPICDAAAVARDIADALKLAPNHAELQKVGQQVIAAANAKASPGLASPDRQVGGSADLVETASFRVRYSGDRALADAVAKAAEAQRKAIFERWSGPPAAAWNPKCEIVIHPTAEVYAKATNRPATGTGHAAVRLSNGRATERRIDLRADDLAAASNTLPRELTHVVLADLFPDRPPPKWAEEGMAVLAGSPEEAGRFTRTLARCARDGEWFALAQLMDLKDFPAEKITGFYCQSVSLTEYLIRAAGGERNFTLFLRDCHRYGTAQAIRRQYGVDGPQALEQAWKRAALETPRGQAP